MNRPAGMRTYMLVSIGSCVVMLINQYAYQVYHVGDPVRSVPKWSAALVF